MAREQPGEARARHARGVSRYEIGARFDLHHGNRAIAERLYVTQRTVETHLTLMSDAA